MVKQTQTLRSNATTTAIRRAKKLRKTTGAVAAVPPSSATIDNSYSNGNSNSEENDEEHDETDKKDGFVALGITDWLRADDIDILLLAMVIICMLALDFIWKMEKKTKSSRSSKRGPSSIDSSSVTTATAIGDNKQQRKRKFASFSLHSDDKESCDAPWLEYKEQEIIF